MANTTQRYHHGDLARALVDAGHAACRTEGPSGLVIRDLAAQVGVSPAAAYRHFVSIDHLRAAVSQRARETLAARLIAARSGARGGRTAEERARRRLRAIGAAYVEFARDEPNLFDTAFAPCSVPPGRPDAPDAWQVLVAAIDELVAAGAMPQSLRTEAPWLAWSAVHGLASILIRAPLPEPADLERTLNGVLDGVQRALR